MIRLRCKENIFDGAYFCIECQQNFSKKEVNDHYLKVFGIDLEGDIPENVITDYQNRTWRGEE
jgi:hypothetical protein